MSLMKEYSVSLGVRCNFCHAKATDGKDHLDFASDNNKHKDIARYMMKMTAAINEKYFKEEKGKKEHTALMVRCFTCHHGNKEPEAFVMPPEEDHRVSVHLDQLLARRGLTLTELADRVGLTLANLSVLKNGRTRAIRFSTLTALCDELDCQPADLLTVHPSRPRSR